MVENEIEKGATSLLNKKRDGDKSQWERQNKVRLLGVITFSSFRL